MMTLGGYWGASWAGRLASVNFTGGHCVRKNTLTQHRQWTNCKKNQLCQKKG